jgi:hypothetical protein
MRTTLDIDDDVLAAAKELARHEGATAAVAGFSPFAPRPGVITTQSDVDALRDAEGI